MAASKIKLLCGEGETEIFYCPVCGKPHLTQIDAGLCCTSKGLNFVLSPF